MKINIHELAADVSSRLGAFDNRLAQRVKYAETMSDDARRNDPEIAEYWRGVAAGLDKARNMLAGREEW